MKTKYKYLSLLLMAAVLCVGFTACSGDDENDNNGQSGSKTEWLIGYWYPTEQAIADLSESYGGNDDDGYCGGFRCPRFINSTSVQIGYIIAYDQRKSNPLFTKNINGRTYYFLWEDASTYEYEVENNEINVIGGPSFTKTSNAKLKMYGKDYIFDNLSNTVW